ncbi:MAG TPA: hypothetical protein VF669_20210 [Tepidisphaeraceae bacterium]
MGCSSAPGTPPAGPGVAYARDLSPWLADAERMNVEGRLDHLSVASDQGIYFTWSVNPSGTVRPLEVDIRSCAKEVDRLKGQKVVVRGKVICRQPRHLDLIVAEEIVLAPGGIADASDSKLGG